MRVLSRRFDETNDNIATMKAELNNKLDQMKNDLQIQIDTIKQDVFEFKSTCTAELNAFSGRIEKIDARIASTSESVCRLENRTELIAVGIPYLPNENLHAHLTSIAKTIGFDENKLSHVNCKRLRSKALMEGDASLAILQFSMSSLRDEFYAKYYSKRDLCLRHIGFNSDRRIYINENLTSHARAIKRTALRMRREKTLTLVTTKLGIVHVKKTLDGPLLAVSSVDQLTQI